MAPKLTIGQRSSGGAGPVISMYEDARISSVVLNLIFMAIWSGVVNCLISQLLQVRFLCRIMAARGLLSPIL